MRRAFTSSSPSKAAVVSLLLSCRIGAFESGYFGVTKISHRSRQPSSRDVRQMQERRGRYTDIDKFHPRFETYLVVKNEGSESGDANGNTFGSSEWLNDIPKNGARQPPGLGGGGGG